MFKTKAIKKTSDTVYITMNQKMFHDRLTLFYINV